MPLDTRQPFPRAFLKEAPILDASHAVEERVRRLLVQRFGEAWPKGVLALSGGIDSTFLLYVLWRIQYPLRMLMHVNYAVRQAESMEDEKYCLKLSEALGIPLQVHRPEGPAGPNFQNWAREVRYQALDKARQRLGEEAVIFTAHHAGDQAETMLMHLGRGSGLRGIAGMEMFSNRLIRPLLTTPKTDIDDAVAALGLKHRHDASNDTDAYSRNRIRHHVLPALEAALGRRVEKAMAHSALLLQEAERALQQQVQACLEDGYSSGALVEATHPTLQIHTEWLRGTGLVRTILHALLMPKSIEIRHQELMARAVFEAERLRQDAGPWAMETTDEWLYILKKDFIFQERTLETDEGKSLIDNGLYLKWWRQDATESFPPTPYHAFLDAATLRYPLTLRRVLPKMDKMQPLGMKGQHKRVSDMMQHARWPHWQRQRALALVDASGRIAWVPGLRIADWARLKTSSAEMACFALLDDDTRTA